MQIDIPLYRRVSDKIEQYRLRYKSYINDFKNSLSRGVIDIRRLYYILKSLRIYDELRYTTVADDSTKIILSSQLREGGNVIIEDEYSGLKEEKTATEYSEGGFPDKVVENRKYIHSQAPSIDTTIYALQSIAEYSSHLQYWDKSLDEALRSGLNYLRLRDSNRDGLLEQSKGEDWIPLLRRDGCLLYINTLYLKLLEDLYYLYIDKDRDYSRYIRALYTRVYRVMENLFWVDNMYIEYINSEGAMMWRAGVDSSTAARPIIMREGNKTYIHLKNLYDRLYNPDINTLIASEARVKVNREDRNLYRIVTPLQTAIYAMDAAEVGYPNLALKVMDTIIQYTKYNLVLVNDNNNVIPKGRNRDTTLAFILITIYKIISESLKEG